MSSFPEPVDIDNHSESQDFYVDLGAEKKRIFNPVCWDTSEPLLVRQVTQYNQGEHITRLKEIDHQFDMTFPCAQSPVVFINGGSDSSSAPIPWSVTFAPWSLHNLSGVLERPLPQTTLGAKQEAILKLLEFLRVADVATVWRKVIVAVSNEDSMARMVTWFEEDTDNNYTGPTPNLLTEEGRTKHISLNLKVVCLLRRLDVKFWLVPNTQILKPWNGMTA
ncbi:hypothetical protein N0V84_003300 [Fusarium piperis]|uniref:Uncharacterized protein n=1 Tax=Fusarium piperis TaxID=1435070 RepID=A0A9W8WHZ0_9HYPO|nr:hypothetical protein N0V84_003300 [Fusarium piperis]